MTPEQYVTAWNNWLATFPGVCDDINAIEGTYSTVAAGGAYAIPFVIDTSSTSNADPGTGRLRFSSTTQNSSTSLYVDALSSTGLPVTTPLVALLSSSSVIKGTIRLVKVGDPSKFLLFNVTARAAAAGYSVLSVTGVWASTVSPFANGDTVMLHFDRNGDQGEVGPAGSLLRRVSTVNGVASVTPNVSTTDMLVATGQASALSIVNPTGTPAEGQPLLVRIKDNGTARAISWGTAYRAGNELLLPVSTVANKWLYVGLTYNATDAKWDLLSVLNV
jgi:hypothetical protein